jgi:hypothetical protein
VEEEEVKLDLLKTELTSIEAAIRSLDTTAAQIKSWAVTASLAIGGFAVANHKRELLVVGAGAILGF